MNSAVSIGVQRVTFDTDLRDWRSWLPNPS